MFISTSAVPVPIPAPVAVKIVPGVLFAAPINVKSVVPADTIVYTTPTLNAPAIVIDGFVAGASRVLSP